MNTTIPALQHCMLQDGRRLSYTIYGPSSGSPVFYFAGWPASCLDWQLFDPDQTLTQRLHLRVIAIDRPGYGDSDARPGRTLLDSVDDLAQLADALHLPQFALLGYSGGGPFALASAFQLSHRITATALVEGIGPFDVPGTTQGMLRATKMQYWLTRHLPLLYRFMWTQLVKQPDRFIKGALSSLRPPDVSVLSQPTIQRIFTSMIAGLGPVGIQAAIEEGALISRPWGFRLEEITTPVQVWQGAEDLNAPPSMGRYLASVLPRGTLHFLRQEGHISMPVQHSEAILTELLRATPYETASARMAASSPPAISSGSE